MSQYVYGVLSHREGHLDVCPTLLGAKRHATRYGYKIVTCRSVNSGYAWKVCQKIDGKWVKFDLVV